MPVDIGGLIVYGLLYFIGLFVLLIVAAITVIKEKNCLAIFVVIASYLCLPFHPAWLIVTITAVVLVLIKITITSKEQAFGLYSDGQLLTMEQAQEAISTFDQDACDVLLKQFGQPPHLPGEDINSLRERCIENLRSL